MRNWEHADFNRIVCYCKKIDKKTIVDAIEEGQNSLQKIQEATQACTGNDCKNQNPEEKCCSSDILELIRIYASEPELGGSSCGCC